jgi:subtilisin family serine protease
MALAYHQPQSGAMEHKAQARHLFQIESDALLAAIRGAPQILFVAAAGNEDNNADFQQYIPAGLPADNLITVGAVDVYGSEATFSSTGKSVVVHANGVEVDGLVPGGVRMRVSGTSVASPQVANLAAKLLALRPTLTSAGLKALIIGGASRLLDASGQPGRVNLLDPRRSAALAGIDVA